MSKKFPTYKLSDAQLRGIGCIVAHEQGTVAGWFAEASQIANLAELQFGGDLVKCVTSGWYAHGKERYKTGTTNPLILAICRRVFIDGFRTLPRYIDEHDAMSDVASVTEGGKNVKGDKSKWKRHSTIIKNRMSSRYHFYDFPGGYKTSVDPFGYKKKENREKYGDFCYTVEEAWSPIPRLIAFAKNEVGYLEKKSNKDLTSKTANAGKANYTRYGKWIGANGDYWCASFVSWLFFNAFGEALGKKLLCGAYSAACETIRQNFIKKKRYHTSAPMAGDVIFFSGSRHSGANHIGIVYKTDGGTVYTIEGNTSGGSAVIDNGGGVAKKSYALSNSRILGYGRPDYDVINRKSQSSPKAQAASPEPSKSAEKPVVVSYYKKYAGKSISIVDALGAVGVKDTSKAHRVRIARANGISGYTGTASQNSTLLTMLKAGKLKRSD